MTATGLTGGEPDVSYDTDALLATVREALDGLHMQGVLRSGGGAEFVKGRRALDSLAAELERLQAYYDEHTNVGWISPVQKVLEERARAEAAETELERVEAERDGAIANYNERQAQAMQYAIEAQSAEARLDKALSLCNELFNVFYPHLDESERVRLRAAIAEIEGEYTTTHKASTAAADWELDAEIEGEAK